MNRRAFLAALPPMPFTVLRSPKDQEFQDSLRKVPSAIGVQSQVSVTPQVVPGQITNLKLTLANGNATISWDDGTLPFQVYTQDDLGQPWMPIGPYTGLRTVTVPMSAQPRAFYRVRENVPMQITAVSQPDGVHLNGTPPTF